MMIQRLIAVVMILGSSVLVGLTSGDITFPAILSMLGLLGVLRRFTWDIRPERHFITPLLLLLLAILFALHCRYAHVRPDQTAAFAWQTIARYFLASMILLLFLRPHRTRDGGLRMADFGLKEAGSANLQSAIRHPQSSVGLPHSLGLFHLASALAAGQVLLLDDRYVAFRLMELLSVTLAILYAALDGVLVVGTRTPVVGTAPSISNRLLTTGYRLPVCLALLLLVAINVGWIGGSMLYRHVETINFLPALLSRGSVSLDSTTAQAARVGFSASGKLSTVLAIKDDADTTPILTVTGNNPVYLRAMAFVTYQQSAWHELSSWEALAPEQNLPFGVLLVGRANLFRLHNEEAPREVVVRHESTTGDVMFTPLGTCFVEGPFSLVMRDDDDVVKSANVRSRQSYRVGYTAAPSRRPPTGLQGHHMTELPKQLDPRIRQRAIPIFRGCTTTAQKIEAVTRYFHTNYTYVLGLDVPPEQDALNYFLLEASTGYCEYFASGAAILLRLAGVPTRYVTGFLVTERGDDSRTWVARNMDAHAWVEAWDAQQGQWVIVEATTQEGLGDTSLANELARSAGGGQPLLTRLAEALYEYGLFGVIAVVWRFTGLVLLLLTVVIVARILRSGRMIRRWRSGPRTQGQDGLATLHRLLIAMDRKTKALGYRRQPEETLHAFAGRISRSSSQMAVPGSPSEMGNGRLSTVRWLAAWYLQYAGLRYARVLDPAQIELLQRLATESQDRR